MHWHIMSKDALPFVILAPTSSSIMTFWDSILPQEVNIFTVLRFWPLTVIIDSIYGFPGTGWCSTSAFVVLMVRLKFVEASENLSMVHSCQLESHCWGQSLWQTEDLGWYLPSLGFCLKPPEVEQFTMGLRSDTTSNVIISEGIS